MEVPHFSVLDEEHIAQLLDGLDVLLVREKGFADEKLHFDTLVIGRGQKGRKPAQRLVKLAIGDVIARLVQRRMKRSYLEGGLFCLGLEKKVACWLDAERPKLGCNSPERILNAES